MSNSILGKVVDEHGQGLPGLQIQALAVNGLHGDVQLGFGQSDNNGIFSFPFTTVVRVSTIRVSVYDSVQRLLDRLDVPDSASVNIVANFSIPLAVVKGLPVSTESGETRYITTGNTIEFLIDDESAWGRLTDAVHLATKSVHLLQFGFDIAEYSNDPTKVQPTVITKFEKLPEEGKGTLRVQLEREMADASARNVQVRVVMHHSALWGRPVTWSKPWEKLLDVILALVLPDDLKSVESYFQNAANGPPPLKAVEVRGFANDRPTHAKLAIVDEQAFLLGSPLIQEYYDRTRFQFDSTGAALPPVPNHLVTELTRGKDGSCRRPIHDVSVLVRGPAVADIDRAFLLHWNEARPDKSVLGEVPAPAPLPAPGGVKVQVVRSLCRDRFSDPHNVDKTNPDLIKGEAYILQAYLRAISQAKRYIYIENQYFVDPRITTAVLNRMKEEKDLQLILLLNNWADIPFYSSSVPCPILSLALDFIFEGRQQNRLEDLLKGLTPAPAEFNKRVGAFTLWSHGDAAGKDPRKDPRPQLINNYLHSKVAIVDDIWATVGSANLDVFSLSNEDNSEVNVVVFEDATTQIADFRRRLWAEHLGLLPSQILDSDDYLALWNRQGEAKLSGLTKNPQLRMDPRILPFPPYPHVNKNISFDVYKPDAYLLGLGIDTRKFHILRKEPAFDFATGQVTPEPL